MEHGATRNFQAEKLMEEEEKKIVQDREEEELNNPMKVCVYQMFGCFWVKRRYKMNPLTPFVLFYSFGNTSNNKGCPNVFICSYCCLC